MPGAPQERVARDEATERTALIADAAARAAAYVLGSSGRPVAPTGGAVAGLGGFDRSMPDEPVPAGDVLDRLDRLGSQATVVSNAGRYFGFVNGGTDSAANAAAMLAGAWDQNAALPVMSPVAAHLDELAAGWVCSLLGVPPPATATFCAGATIANLTGVVAGRDALLERLGWSVDERGLSGSPPIRVATGAEVHVSVLKALRVAGIGRDAVTFAATDACGRVVAGTFPEVDERTLVVLQAGNVNTGHSDPFDPLVERAHDRGAWVHVDGAFGLWAAAARHRRSCVAGFEKADSWATDAHKWLNAPYDCGIAICARPEDLHRAFAADAAYVATDDARAAMQISLQMSQRARGVEIWALLASRGRRGIEDLIERSCALTERFAGILRDGGVEILAPVVLNQALAHFGDDATTDAVIDAVQRDGTCWVGPTSWHGRRAMRLSVSDQATTADDVDASAAAILRCYREVRR